MTFADGFDKYANVWCRKCGRGDSIIGHRQMHRHETFQVEDIDSPDGWATDVTEDQEGETLYTCSFCNNEGTDLSEVVTASQNEAYNIYKARAKVPEPQKEEDYPYEDDD